MAPKLVVPVAILLGLILNLFMFWECRSLMDWRRIFPLTLGGLVGLPFGAKLLLVLDETVLKAGIAFVVLLFALVLLVDFRYKWPANRVIHGLVGLNSGVLNAAIAMGGPPVILYFTGQGLEKERFRADITGFFLSINTVALPVLFLDGLWQPAHWELALQFIPVLLLGVYFGGVLSRRLSRELFRKITLYLLFSLVF